MSKTRPRLHPDVRARRDRRRGLATAVSILFWGLVALGLLFIAAPYGVGLLLEQHFDRNVAHLAQQNHLEVVDKQLWRGWFGSTASLQVRPRHNLLCGNSQCPVITVKSHIHHGPWGRGQSLKPVLAQIDTRIEPAALWPELEFKPPLKPIHLRTRIDLLRRSRTRLAMGEQDSRVSQDDELAHMVSSELAGQVKARLARHQLGRLELDWPAFALTLADGGHISWQDLHLQAEPGLSRPRLQAQSLTLDNGHGHATRLRDIQLGLTRLQDGANAIAAHIKHIVLPDNSQAGLYLEASHRGKYPIRWQQLARQLTHFDGRLVQLLASTHLYRDILPNLLPAGSQTRLQDIELDTSAGRMTATGHINMPERPRRSSSAAELLAQMDLHLRLSLPAQTLEKLLAHGIQSEDDQDPEQAVAERLDELENKHWLTPRHNGRRYRLDIRIQDGQLYLNGRQPRHWQERLDKARRRLAKHST